MSNIFMLTRHGIALQGAEKKETYQEDYRMKRALVILASFAAMVIAAHAIFTQGWGQQVTVTTTPVQLTGFTVNQLNVNNNSTSLVYTLVNCDTGTLMRAIAASNAIPVATNTSFKFDAQGKANITSIALVTTSGTATIQVGGF